MRAHAALILLLTVLVTAGTAQRQDRFERFVTGEQGLRGDYFFCAVEDERGFIWIGGQTGLQRYDGRKFESFGSRLTHPYVHNMHVAPDGKMWICTRSGLNLFDPVSFENIRFHSEPEDSTSLIHRWTEPVLIDRSERVWIGTYHGLSRYLPEEQSFHNYVKSSESGVRSENRYLDILQDVRNDDLLWLGSYRGLQAFSISSGTFTEVDIQVPVELIEQEARKPGVLGLHQDASGVLWVGLSGSNDIVRFDPEQDTWNKYSIPFAEPLTPNRERGTYDFIRISENELLVSMVTGIGVLNTSSGEFFRFDIDPASDFAAHPSAVRRMLVDSRGHLWLPSLTGISRSMEPVIPSGRKAGRVAVTKVSVDSLEWQGARKRELPQLTLTNPESKVTIEFCLPNPPRSREPVQYSYRLLGRSNTWEQTETGLVEFGAWSPGSYDLELRARSGQSGWTEAMILPIGVDVAWWRTLWFKLGALGVLLGLALLLAWSRWRYMTRTQRMKERYEKQLTEVQLHSLRSQMNPHFLFNTMNSINHYILQNKADAASSYLTKFSRLVRQVLNNSRSHFVCLADELEALRLYVELEQLRFEHVFEFIMQVEPDVDVNALAIPPLVIQPYVENAIWHGLMPKEGDGKLSIHVSTSAGELVVSVRDNGIGREASRQYASARGTRKSLGMQITNERVELVNLYYQSQTDIEIIDHADPDGTATGTEVVINLPAVQYEREASFASP